MFRESLCPSSGAQEYYTVVAACGISCCRNVKSNFVSFCGICVLSLKCRVLSGFVTRCVECRGGYKKTYQEHPHTAPTTFDTPGNKPRERTTLKTENTNSTKTYEIIFYISTARNTTGSNHCIIFLSS